MGVSQCCFELMNEFKLLSELLSVKTLLKAASLQKLEAENQDAGYKLRDAVQRGGQYIDIVNILVPSTTYVLHFSLNLSSYFLL